MHIRRSIVAVFLGLSLAAGAALADTSTGTKDKPGTGKESAKKGKPGAACKTNADCDQSQMPQMCIENKCAEHHISPPVT